MKMPVNISYSYQNDDYNCLKLKYPSNNYENIVHVNISLINDKFKMNCVDHSFQMDSTNLANEMGTAIDMHANNVFNGMIPMNVSEIN